VDDGVFDDASGLARPWCIVEFTWPGTPDTVIAFYQRILAKQPFTLAGYTIELEEGGQQAARGLFTARTDDFVLQELEVIISTNLWDPDETQVRVHWE